jgi:hypothetical protein
MSRRFGGIHFESDDLAGRALGRAVAIEVWDKLQLTSKAGTSTNMS